MADLLISFTGAIHFCLLIALCDYNIITNVSYLNRSDCRNDENYSMYITHLPNSTYILANLIHTYFIPIIPPYHLSDGTSN